MGRGWFFVLLVLRRDANPNVPLAGTLRGPDCCSEFSQL